MREKIKVGIINVTGYLGVELARLLLRHPGFELIEVTGRSQIGTPLGDVFPHLGESNLIIQEQVDRAELVFCALPHKSAAETITPLVQAGKAVVDVSADFRLKSAAEYQQWYEHEHPSPDLLKDAVYGLAEVNRAAICQAKLLANPGCYPTASILGLAPALAADIIGPGIIIDAKSGISGAGRNPGLSYHYPEATESVTAYGLNGHRHLPEIVQELAAIWPQSKEGRKLRVTFTPHLVPMTRGILATSYADLQRTLSTEEVRALYSDFYKGSRFVRVVSHPPATKQTWGSNLCLLYPLVDSRTDRLVVISCLDNLVKGGSGQAVQCANLMCGFPEETGVDLLPVYP